MAERIKQRDGEKRHRIPWMLSKQRGKFRAVSTYLSHDLDLYSQQGQVGGRNVGLHNSLDRNLVRDVLHAFIFFIDLGSQEDCCKAPLAELFPKLPIVLDLASLDAGLR